MILNPGWENKTMVSLVIEAPTERKSGKRLTEYGMPQTA